LLLGLALTGLLLVVLGATVGWGLHQRRQATRHQVETLLHQSDNLAEQAAASPANEQALARYREAASLTEQAWQLLQAAPGGRALQEQVQLRREQLRNAVGLREKDQAFVDRLAEVRAQKEDQPGNADADGRYRTAFRENGLDVEKQPVDALASAIAARPASVVRDVVAALDDWCGERRRLRRSADQWQPLLALARALDDDPWRNDLRRLIEPPAGAVNPPVLAVELASQLTRAHAPALPLLVAEVEQMRRRLALLELARRADLKELPPASVQLLAAQLRHEGEHAETVRLLRGAVNHHPEDAWLSNDLALALHYQPRPRLDEAIRFYSAARAVRPEVGHSLAHALLQRGQNEEAVALFRELARRRPDNFNHTFCLGTCLAQLDRHDEAVVALRRAVRLGPRSAIARASLAQSLGRTNRPTEAEEHFHAAIALEPESGQLWVWLGEFQFNRRRFAEAEASFRRGVALSPNALEGWFRLAYLYGEQNRTTEAIRCYNELLARAPDHAAGLSNLAMLLWHQGQVERARQLLETAVRLEPNLVRARQNLGRLLAQTGRYAAALAHLQFALAHEPDNVLNLNGLAVALFQVGRPEEGITHYERSLELEPKQPIVLYNLGNLYAGQGRLGEAVCCLLRAVELDPTYAEAWCNLGQNLRRSGLFVEARDALAHGHALGQQRGWAYPSARWLHDTERLVAVEPRLGDLLKGAGPADNVERLTAVRALFFLGRHGDSVRMLELALDAEPELAGRPGAFSRPRAAASALLMSLAPEQDARRRAVLRRKALRWLKQEVEHVRLLFAERPALAREAAAALAGEWQLWPLRDPQALADLPADERTRFSAVWNEAQRLAALAQTVGAP
jgi:tetratricopeptide (TPR) repeat protein